VRAPGWYSRSAIVGLLLVVVGVRLHAEDLPRCSIRTVVGSPTTAAGDGGPASQAQLLNAVGLIVGRDGSVFVGDAGNRRVRKIDPAGVISTVVGPGNGVGDFLAATSLALASDGALLASSYGTLLRITSEGTVSSISLGSVGTSRIAADGKGRVYFADSNNSIIRRIDLASGEIDIAVGAIPAPQPYLFPDEGLAANEVRSEVSAMFVMPDDSLVFASNDGVLWRVGPDGRLSSIAGKLKGDAPRVGAHASTVQFTGIQAAARDVDGALFIARARENVIWRIPPEGILEAWNTPGPVMGLVPDNGSVLATVGNSQIFRFRRGQDPERIAGERYFDLKPDAGTGQDARLQPSGLAADAEGNLLIADPWNSRIWRLTRDGTVSAIAGGGTEFVESGVATQMRLTNPEAVAVGPNGDIWIADTLAGRIRKLRSDGTMLTAAGNSAFDITRVGDFDRSSPLQSVVGWVLSLASDRDGSLYFVDSLNGGRLIRFRPAREQFDLVLSSVDFRRPGTSLAFDSENQLLLLPYSGNTVLRVADGQLGTFVTWPTIGYVSAFTLDAETGVFYYASLGGIFSWKRGENPRQIVGSTGGAASTSDGIARDGWVTDVVAMLLDQSGHLFVSEKSTGRVRVIDAVRGCLN
jgi:sugar lactone lactonase YvrE